MKKKMKQKDEKTTIEITESDFAFLNRLSTRLDVEYPIEHDMNKKRVLATAMAIQYALSSGLTLEMYVAELRAAWGIVAKSLGAEPTQN